MKYRGYIFGFLSAALYASVGIFVKHGISREFNPVDLIMLQEIIAIPILFVFCFFRYKSQLKLSKLKFRRFLILGGIANTGIMVCNYISYKYLSIAVATVILFTYPALVAVAAAVIFKQRISGHKILAIIGTFLGCLLVINIFSPQVAGKINLAGVFYAFLAAVLYAFFNLYANKILDDTEPVVITFYNAVFTLGVLLMFNFGFLYKFKFVNGPLITNTTMLAILCGIIPATLYYHAIRHIGSVSSSILSTLEIPIASLFSLFIMGDGLSPLQITGILVSVFSVILLRFEKKAEQNSEIQCMEEMEYGE